MGLARTLAVLLLLALTAPLTAEVNRATCLDCHTPSADVPVHAIFNTPHGALAGGGNDSCKACHGASEDHVKGPSSAAPDASFGPRWFSEAEERSGACLASPTSASCARSARSAARLIASFRAL